MSRRLYEYDISKANLQVAGTSLDVRSAVREIIIFASLSMPYPLVSVSFLQLITRQFQTKYMKLDMQIDVWREFDQVKRKYRFKLVPFGTDTTIYMPDQTHKYYTMTANREFIEFTPEPCYKLATKEVGPVVEHNKPIKDIYEKNKNFFPKVKSLAQDFQGNPKTEYRNCILSQKKIDQFFMPKQSFLQALKYCQYWWGWYPNATIITIIPEFDINPIVHHGKIDKAYLLIFDANQAIKMMAASQDNKIFIRDGNADFEDWAQDFSLDKDLFVIVPSVIKNRILSIAHEQEYVVINKPKDLLYHRKQFKIKKLLDEHGIVFMDSDPKRDNYSPITNTPKRIISNHTGYEKNYDHFTSGRTTELGYGFRMEVESVLPIAITAIWPGNLARVRFLDADKQKFGGIWIVESVLHRLTREHGREWQHVTSVTLVRSNLAQFEGSAIAT